MIKITKAQVEKARSKNLWTFGNQVLYDLCKNHPTHVNDEEIIAKIWLIGRSYAAAIERRKKTTEETNEGFYEDQVAPTIRKSNIDEHLNQLRSYDKVDYSNIDTVLKTHKYLVSVCHTLTNQDKRSLVSKYLHFHLPELFFIYDSRADYAIANYVSFRKRMSKNEAYDDYYHKFSLKCLELRNHIYEEYGILLNPREIDNLLLQP